jgi:hypothetical protein
VCRRGPTVRTGYGSRHTDDIAREEAAAATSISPSSGPRFFSSVNTCSQYFASSPPVAGPDAEDVAGAVHGRGHHHVDRTVRELPVPDLDVDGADERTG